MIISWAVGHLLFSHEIKQFTQDVVNVIKTQARMMIPKGKSDLIKGFKSKKDTAFDAYSIIFEFPERNRKE